MEQKCYSQEDLSLFKLLISEKKEKATAELLFLKGEAKGNENDTKDTFGLFSRDEGEEDISFKLNQIERKKIQIQELEDACLRIEDGNYGICNCSFCRGELISKDRLKASPTAVVCAGNVKKI